MTGLADEPDASYWNPAGLAFQTGTGATASYANWLPGLYPGLTYASGAFVRRLSAQPWQGGCASVGVDITYFNYSGYSLIEPEGPTGAWRGALGATVAVGITRSLALGLAAKGVHSQHIAEWVWKEMPELGIEAGGTGTALAFDLGILCHPHASLSVGLSAANLGPGISYTTTGEHDPTPSVLRLGACWTPVNNRWVRLRVLPELDKVLVGMFSDTSDLGDELASAWKALGVELTAAEVVSLRIGYFEDIAWDRGGIVFERDGWTTHHPLWDVLTRSDLGKFNSVGLCWGLGVGYKDIARFDFGTDAAIYDFKTSNSKFTLTVNDISALSRLLTRH